jgi:hypothetical protein
MDDINEFNKNDYNTSDVKNSLVKPGPGWVKINSQQIEQFKKNNLILQDINKKIKDFKSKIAADQSKNENM